MNKNPEITEATRSDLIRAFCDYYLERPIEKITVKEVAEKAGYSRVTFYNYFRDVYDLLHYMEEDFISHIAKEISRSITEDRGFHNFVFTFNNLITANKLYSQVFLNNPHSSQFFARLKDKIIPLALQSFGISPDNQKAVYAFEFYIPGVISIISCWLKNNQDMPVDELAALIKGILQDGLLSQLHDLSSPETYA